MLAWLSGAAAVGVSVLWLYRRASRSRVVPVLLKDRSADGGDAGRSVAALKGTSREEPGEVPGGELGSRAEAANAEVADAEAGDTGAGDAEAADAEASDAEAGEEPPPPPRGKKHGLTIATPYGSSRRYGLMQGADPDDA